MSRDLGYFSYLFLLESYHGAETVDLDTLRQSKVRKVVSLLIALSVLLVGVSCLVFTAPEDVSSFAKLTIAYYFLNLAASVYTLVIAVYQYKTKVSAALNSLAMERLLRPHCPRHRSGSRIKLTVVVSVLVVTQIINAVVKSVRWTTSPLWSALWFYMHSLKACTLCGCFMFTLKVLDLYKDVHRCLEQFDEHDTRRTAVELQAFLRLLRVVLGSLHYTASATNSRYKIFVLWIAITAAFFLPYSFYQELNVLDNLPVTLRLVYMFYIFCICLFYGQIMLVKIDIVKTLCSLKAKPAFKMVREDINRQVLAVHHRGFSFDCYVFNMGHTLFTSILDTSAMVVSALFNTN